MPMGLTPPTRVTLDRSRSARLLDRPEPWLRIDGGRFLYEHSESRPAPLDEPSPEIFPAPVHKLVQRYCRTADEAVELGASPRGSVSLYRACQALAAVESPVSRPGSACAWYLPGGSRPRRAS